VDYTGVVDQDIYPAVLFGNIFNSFFNGLAVSDIERGNCSLAPGVFNHRQGLFRSRLITIVVDDYKASCPCQLHADCPADSFAAAGDDGYFIFIFNSHFSLRSSYIQSFPSM